MPLESNVNKLDFIKVSKAFDRSGLILKELDLKIALGDFVVVLGPSGSGKSTLLRLMAGLENVTQGQINYHAPLSHDKGFVFQDAHLMPWRSLVENVELPLELMKMSAEERRTKALKALEMVRLSQAADLTPNELSGGMKMRGSLARALVAEPSLLLLDEPFAALDEQTRFKLAEELRALWLEKRMTVVFVTHSVHEACFLANRIVTLSEKPAKIEHDFSINLPERRLKELRTDAQFMNELKRIYNIVSAKNESSAL